ncbi:DDE-type integrase/transposase/recombinase [Microbacterium rhizomatis]|uniref:DDE-type integrase/transposase/recombinase n=1 Tax=Microbacterium rhizomatis TaxID=1631477 RepID=A0A5J5J545_9MICO|nr:DDE-type integrase/transposase/recombinase [Microbacterium rhizomatis]KAA9111150.1 DDE-type integrase/transposase/recombinase [Microbacterium rhizomatis]
MRLAGVEGVKRSKRVFTTKSDPAVDKPEDLVQRRFTAPGPRRLWVADVTYVAIWSGFAYAAFVTDVYSRRIVGWNVASTLRSDILPLRALDMAAWAAGGRPDGLIHHADHGSNYRPIGTRVRPIHTQDVYADLFDDDLEDVATRLDEAKRAASVVKVLSRQRGREV